MAAAVEARRFYVSGYVQGVGYRFFAQHAADRLGIRGYVKNLRDGRVEVYAIGSADDLLALCAQLRRGPSGASIDEVAEDAADLESEFANTFSIEYDD